MPVATHKLRWWHRFVVLLVVLLLPTAMPPKWFPNPESLSYDRVEGNFTFSRAPASFAYLFERCQLPKNADDVEWCEAIDERFPVVFAKWDSTAFFLSEPLKECRDDGFSHYQWKPTNTAMYPAGALRACFNNHDTMVRTSRRIFLFGFYPLAKRLVTRDLFQPLPNDQH